MLKVRFIYYVTFSELSEGTVKFGARRASYKGSLAAAVPRPTERVVCDVLTNMFDQHPPEMSLQPGRTFAMLKKLQYSYTDATVCFHVNKCQCFARDYTGVLESQRSVHTLFMIQDYIHI